MNAAHDARSGLDFHPSAIFSAHAWSEPMPTTPDFEPAMPSWMAPKSVETTSRTPLDAPPPLPEVEVPPLSEPIPPSVTSRFPSRAPGPEEAQEVVISHAGSALRAPSVPHLTPDADIMALEARHHAEVEELRAQLRQSVAALALARRELLMASEPEIVKLALAVAERVAGRALETDPELVRAWVHEGAQHLADQDDVQVVVAPDVAARLGDVPLSTADGTPLQPQIDASLPAGHCELRGQFSRVDASLQARLAAVARELHSEAP